MHYQKIVSFTLKGGKMKAANNQNNEELRTDNKRKQDKLEKNHDEYHPLKDKPEGITKMKVEQKRGKELNKAMKESEVKGESFRKKNQGEDQVKASPVKHSQKNSPR